MTSMYEILESLTGIPAYKLLDYDSSTVTISYYPNSPGKWLIKYSSLIGLEFFDLLGGVGIEYEVIEEPNRYSKIVKLSKDNYPFIYNQENLRVLEMLARSWQSNQHE